MLQSEVEAKKTDLDPQLDLPVVDPNRRPSGERLYRDPYSCNSPFEPPLQDQNILNTAYQNINNGTQSYNDVVGYLSKYDQANGTNLAAQLQLNVQPQGGIFGQFQTYKAPQA
jgi:hypothetical protein